MHYRKLFLLTATILFPLFLKAQDTSRVLRQPQKNTLSQDTIPLNTIPNDSILNNEIRRMNIKYRDTALHRLLHQLKEVKENEKQNTTAIHGLLQGKQIDNRTKYKLMKTNLINATQTYYLLNQAIIDLKSRTTTNNLSLFITSLNNPESKALGFSFSERIIDLVKTVVLHGKADKNKRTEKIVKTTESIVNSPIFKGLVGLTPPLAIANSIMTFFHTLSVNNKEINAETLKKFEDELNKYVSYYTVLNEGNQKFQYGLNFNKDQLNMLQQNMYDHLLFTASALGISPPHRKGGEPLGVTLNRYFLTFNKETTTDFFDKLEKKYTIPGTKKLDYEKLLRENMSLKEANNQLEDLVMQTKRFENLYNEYFNLVNSYYDKVVSALNLAQDSGLASKNIIKQKQQEFSMLKSEAMSDIKASINIRELENNTDNIKYRYKIF
jgi:hypothetical protein